MPTVTWTPNYPPIVMDPDDIRDFEFEFSAWLGTDEVDGPACSALAEGCTAEVGDTTTTGAVLRVTGPGQVGTGTATLRLVTVGGRQSDRSIRLNFKDQ